MEVYTHSPNYVGETKNLAYPLFWKVMLVGTIILYNRCSHVTKHCTHVLFKWRTLVKSHQLTKSCGVQQRTCGVQQRTCGVQCGEQSGVQYALTSVSSTLSCYSATLGPLARGPKGGGVCYAKMSRHSCNLPTSSIMKSSSTFMLTYAVNILQTLSLHKGLNGCSCCTWHATAL